MTTFDFTTQDPNGKTAEYELPLVGAPTLTVLHAGMTNKPYTNSLAKMTAKSGAAKRIARGQVTAELLEENLDLDRRLFAQHVVVGWSGVKDAAGKKVTFSKASCADLLAALPAWIMQDLSRFAAQATNFVSSEDPTDEEVEEQAGK